MTSYLTRVIVLLATALLTCTVGLTAMAQVQPTAEQMRLINQLPSAQRQQALQALKEAQGQGTSTDTGQPRSINEPLGESATSELAEWGSEIDQTEVPKVEGRSRLVITFTPKSGLSDADLDELASDPVLSRLSGSQFFRGK